ncbi:hypothetical protein BDN70DRAFT_993009 [Pholiota conissans]|uniref:Elongator complex protein 4 n=1 Tax=Pholiota conissans TaxID=109636 RepID=A0A9P6D1C1_9AGAR|nr:hypothetical protein BDN70DRAFT_993009 [Pholiota conissans]
MSSFKRKPKSTTGDASSSNKPTSEAATPLTVYPGTRISPASTLSLVTSTGISSLDDILGGGLPLSCSLVIAAPDMHSSYGELVQKNFVAQGLASGQRVCVVGADASAWVREVMWMPDARGVPVRTSGGAERRQGDSDEEEKESEKAHGGKVTIAWRYEKMRQFQTTTSQEGETFCAPFELGSRVPEEVIAEAVGERRLTFVEVGRRVEDVLRSIAQELAMENALPVRICVPWLGTPAWGDLTPQDVLYFLHALRSLLRSHTHGCASVGLAPQMSAAGWGGAGWMDKVGWAADGALMVAAFSANPALSSMFPGHHGLLQTQRLPAPHTLLAPSDRFSTLRGLGGSGENNLAFRCTRKRLVFETLHLDVEGGTAERRTTAAAGTGQGPGTGPGRPKKKRVGFSDDLY